MGDSLFSDELSTHFTVSGRSLAEAIDVVRTDQEVTPPLYFVLAWATKGIGGVPEALRLVPLVAGIAAVPLTWALGAWTTGRRAGLVAAALVALSPILILYSTQARGYALAMTLALASTVTMLRALDRGGVGWWTAYAALSAATVWTHYTAVFVLAAQLGWALWFHRDAWRSLLGANAAAALAYLPWLPGFREDVGGLNQIATVHPFSFNTLVTDMVESSIGFPGRSVDVLPGGIGVALILCGLAVGAAAWLLGRARRAQGWPQASERVVLVVALALSTPAGLALASIVGDDVLFPRNLIVSLPGLAVAVAALLTAARGPVRILAPALVLAGLAFGSLKMLQVEHRSPDYQAAAALIERGSPDGAVVLEIPFGATPTSALEVALSEPDQPRPTRNRVLRLGVPSLRDQIRGQAAGVAPTGIPAPPPAGPVRRAGRAARGGTLWFVTAGPRADLPRRFREVRSAEFNGKLVVTVSELRDEDARERDDSRSGSSP